MLPGHQKILSALVIPSHACSADIGQATCKCIGKPLVSACQALTSASRLVPTTHPANDYGQ